MDAGYDALEEAASSYAKTRERGDDDGRSHRSHRDREHERDRGHERDGERDRDGQRERRHRERGGEERDDRYRERDNRDRERGGDRDRERERDGYRGGHDRERERERYDRDREREYDERPRRRRRDDEDVGLAAEPMGGHRDRRPRHDEGGYSGGGGGGGGFAQPMRGHSPPRGGRRNYDDRDFGRDRDRGGGRRDDRRRLYSPGRSPTPTNAVPLEQRHVENSHWDERPPQFEGIGAMDAKMTGMFTYGPGRVPPPLHLGVPPSLMAGAFPPSNPVRQTKRLYVGGITESMTESFIQDFFNALMHEHKLAVDMPGEPVAQCQINQERSFAFAEFRTSDEATAALQFDGVMCEGVPLRVRRPKDYAGLDPLSHAFGAPGSTDSPNKLFVGGLPTYLNDEQVMELLKSFGELKSFNLVKEGAGVSKGFAFCEYLDGSVTEMAIQGLNGFALGDRNLVVQRAAVGRNTGSGPTAMPGSAGYLHQAAPNILQSAHDAGAPTSRCMLLLNMVTPEELVSDDDYNDILEDINEECGKYGSVEGVRIPRPTPKSKKWEPTDSAAATAEKNRKADEEAGVGRVYVLFKDLDGVQKGMKAIGGRQFAGRTILVANVSEEEFLGPAPPPPPPEAPEDIDAAAADALKDIMSGLE